MKYTKKNQIKNVKAFNPKTGDYSYTENRKNYLFLDGVLMEKEKCPITLSDRGEYMYAWYSLGKTEIYQGHTLLNSIESGTHLLDGETHYIGKHDYHMEDCRSYYNLLSPLDGRSLFKEDSSDDLHIVGELLFGYDNFENVLKRIDTDTTSIWEFPMGILGGAPYELDGRERIKDILGVIANNLWFYTNCGRLVALHIETGEIVKVFSCLEMDKERGYIVREGLSNCFLHTDHNIYSMGNYYFTLINTEECSIKEYYNIREADPNGAGSYSMILSPLFQNDYFTFVGEKPMETYGCGWVGIFDYKARKLVWECEIVPQEERKTTRNKINATQHLYMSGDKLYVKDAKDTLHIFEIKKKDWIEQ